MVEAKRPLKAQLTAEVAAAPTDAAADAIRIKFDSKEKALENELDHKPLESESPRLPPAPSHPLSHASRTLAQRSAHGAGVGLQLPVQVKTNRPTDLQLKKQLLCYSSFLLLFCF